MAAPLLQRSHQASVPRPAKSGEVYEAVKREIMLGGLPPGDPLVELELAAAFGCSQGPVREALLQLQEEGLVIRQGHRGTRVADCTADEAVEMFRLRQSIECRSVIRALQRPSRTLTNDLEALIKLMEDAAQAGDEYKLAVHDRDFHRRLLRDANLPALEPILHRCLVHNHRFKISQSTGERDLLATARRHFSILEAVGRADAAAAAQALAHHIATIVDLGPDVFAHGEQ
ncbi:GntR family transcriptional regulator [Microvirga arabica]|uniref:GntR family transcriptional regulator n=1 Tax=Microvirga arabica TaxID=1128671 RepID=A0ABV6YA69_9HYPH|nr:GntR family transcriptional regulator [Microvirga arabica]MBM1175037.1 GntR family transcriptional regulator [Microvirga arabica]